jgi:PIN domain nuclease of toxin-antitoxin system
LKLLLDTHIWLWTVLNPSRLGRNTVNTLHDEGNELWLSPISTWEALQLHDKGRIELLGDSSSWIESALLGINEAVLTHEIVLAARELRLHKDPADRFIAATAQVLDLTLLTADERLLGLGSIKTLGNR